MPQTQEALQQHNALVMEALQQCHASTMEARCGNYSNPMLVTKML